MYSFNTIKNIPVQYVSAPFINIQKHRRVIRLA